jgi:RNase P subunit RPR2
MKSCSVCKEEKSLEHFYKDSSTADKKSNRCKSCQSAYYKGYNASRKTAKARYDVKSKVCRDCGLEKPISQFGKKSTSLDKHQIYCNPCWRQRTYESMRRNAR